jgi:chromosome segregation ATPase
VTKNSKHKLDPHAHDRIDAMARAFAEMQKTIDKWQARQTQRNARLEQDSHDLHAAMAALEESVAHAPNVQRQLKDEIHGLRSQLPPLRDRLDELEAEFMLNISAEVDDNGKAIYKNEDLRGAAMALAKANRDEYQETLEKVRAKEFAIQRKEHELGEYEKQDKANRLLYAGHGRRLDNLTARF